MKLSKMMCAAGIASIALMGASDAAVLDCTNFNIDVSGRVTNTVGCNYSTTYSNDPASGPIEVNDEGGFLGFTDWILEAQGIDPVDPMSGTWDVTGYANHTNYQWLIVFKDGSFRVGQGRDGVNVDTPLVGYLSAPGSFGGDWDTPYVAGFWAPAAPGQDKEVSHISYYKRENPSGDENSGSVPEPASILLMGTGLALVARRLRRS